MSTTQVTSENTKEERLAGLLYPTITVVCLVVVLALLYKQQEFNIVRILNLLLHLHGIAEKISAK
jgi:hypothetical protein